MLCSDWTVKFLIVRKDLTARDRFCRVSNSIHRNDPKIRVHRWKIKKTWNTHTLPNYYGYYTLLDIITTRAILILNSNMSAILIIKSRVNWPNMTVMPNSEEMLVFRNIETNWRNHSYHGKEISITHSKCVSVSLAIQHSNFMRRIVMSSVCDMSASTTFFDIIS